MTAVRGFCQHEFQHENEKQNENEAKTELINLSSLKIFIPALSVRLFP
jgi:hypothetical protein